MKYYTKTFFSVIAFGVIFLPFSRAEAAISLADLQKELQVVSVILTNLSVEIQEGKIAPEVARSEIQRISQVINSLVQESALNFYPYYQGQILGVYAGQGVMPLPSREAIVVIEPSSGSGVVRMNIGNTFSSTLLSFTVKPLRSDIEVRRVDITFDKLIWRYVGEITLSAGGKVLVKLDPQRNDFFENTRGEHTIRFGGFSYLIPRNSSRTFTITMKPRDENSAAGELFRANVFLNNGSVRAVDEAGIQHTLPSQHGGPNGSFRREFEIVY